MVTMLVCSGVPETRHSLERCAAQVPGVDRVEQAGTVAEARLLIEAVRPDFVLLDAHLDSTPQALQQLVSALAEVPAIMVGSFADMRAMGVAMAAGVRGFLRADLAPAELAAAIAHASLAFPAVAGLVPEPRLPRPRADLTERELQVLRGMSQGKSNTEIGRNLFLSEDTIKTHASRLFRKLDVNDRAHAVASAFRLGLLS